MEKDQDFERLIEYLQGRGVILTDDSIQRLVNDKVCWASILTSKMDPRKTCVYIYMNIYITLDFIFC